MAWQDGVTEIVAGVTLPVSVPSKMIFAPEGSEVTMSKPSELDFGCKFAFDDDCPFVRSFNPLMPVVVAVKTQSEQMGSAPQPKGAEGKSGQSQSMLTSNLLNDRPKKFRHQAELIGRR